MMTHDTKIKENETKNKNTIKNKTTIRTNKIKTAINTIKKNF